MQRIDNFTENLKDGFIDDAVVLITAMQNFQDKHAGFLNGHPINGKVVNGCLSKVKTSLDHISHEVKAHQDGKDHSIIRY